MTLALLLPAEDEEDSGDLRKAARRARARRFREALKAEDDDALAEALFGGEEDDAELEL